MKRHRAPVICLMKVWMGSAPLDSSTSRRVRVTRSVTSRGDQGEGQAGPEDDGGRLGIRREVETPRAGPTFPGTRIAPPMTNELRSWRSSPIPSVARASIGQGPSR